MTSTIFLSGQPVVKSKEQRKISRIARHLSSRVKALRKPAPVTIIYSAPSKEAA